MPLLAAIDIGANSVRLSIADFQGRRRQIVHEDREVTRLGASVFSTGGLDPEAMAHTVRVLRRFRRATQLHGASQVRVVATSALRDAANAGALIDWVRAAVGWTIEVIDGLEEGRLIHLAVARQAHLRRARVLLVDLGGGSCEFTLSVNGGIRALHSLPLGAIRLTQAWLPRDPPRKKDLARLLAHVGAQLDRIAPVIRRAGVTEALATSGTAAALAALNRSPSVSRAQARQLYDLLARLPRAERARLPGIGTRRAEIVVAGAALFAEMLPRFGLARFRYSSLGLRDGLLEQMAAAHPRPVPLPQQRSEALRTLAARYGVDAAHAERVRGWALMLFRRLRRLHQLPAAYADWLAAAALIQDVGHYVNRSGARRHSQYLIAHSELNGFSPPERQLLALLARYQGGALRPAGPPELRRAVALLRLARALDRGHRGAAQAVRLQLQMTRVRLAVRVRAGEGELECWALERERGYFREVFGRALSIAVHPAGFTARRS